MQGGQQGRYRTVAALLAVVLAVSGCSVFGGGTGPRDVTAEFLGAFASGDTARAAALTDSPRVAKTVLDQARTALAPKSMGTEITAVEENSGSEEATASYRLDWRLGEGRRWGYAAKAILRTVDGEWKLRWAPAVVHPYLAAQQSLALEVETPSPAPVLDRHGAPLLQADTVVSVLVDRKAAGERLDHVAGRLAAALHPLDSRITKRSILDGIEKTEDGQSYLAASLRSADYQAVKPAIYHLPGVRFTSQERLLSVRRNLGSQVLPAILGTVNDQVAGRAGWRIVAQDATGAEVAELHAEKPRPAEAVTSTLSLQAQQSAENALRGAGVPGAIVAMQASTGELLAIAQNEKADAQGSIALTGRYPPGSTFKIVTAAAGISAHAVSANSEVECPATTVIGGRLIPNDHRFELGKVPLHTAFARSCNTTFAKLAAELPPDALTETGHSLGIGADFVIPGITTITGSVPPAKPFVQRAENGFGQGKVLASPFGVALAAATVAGGETPTPSLLRGVATETTRKGEPLKPGVIEALRRMMREVVTKGTATRLADLRGVHGKTGTAQFGDGTNSHGWFAGYQGDVAFAVLLVGAGSSDPAVDVTHGFLTGLR